MSDRKTRAMALYRFLQRALTEESLTDAEWATGMTLVVADADNDDPVMRAPVWYMPGYQAHRWH